MSYSTVHQKRQKSTSVFYLPVFHYKIHHYFYINLQQYSPVSTDRAVIRTILNSSNRHNLAKTRKAKLVAYKNVLIQTLFKLNPESCPQSNVPALLRNKLNHNSNSKCFQLKYFWNNIFKLNPLNFFICLFAIQKYGLEN